MSETARPLDRYVDANGVRLHYLDWGGSGPPLVLLAGFGNTPHFFGGMATRFVDRFRVVGLSRRAHGASEAPELGYDVPTLAEDIVALLDELGVERGSFVGHSFAGVEMIQLAAAHPERVDRLVFLDALYYWAEGDAGLLATDPLRATTPPPDDFASVEAYSQDFVTRYPAYRRLRSPRWDKMMSHALERTADGRYRERLRPRVAKQLGEAHGTFDVAWRSVRCPALAIYAFQDGNWALPDGAPDELRKANWAFVERLNLEHKRRCIDRARTEIADIRVVELEGASHYCFLDREDEVVDAMRRFLASAR